MVSEHYFLCNITIRKIKVTCNIGWSSSIYRFACAIPDPDTDTVAVTGGKYILTTVSRYGNEGWREDFSSGLNTGRYHHGCTSFLAQDYTERVKVYFNIYLMKLIIYPFRCCWSLGAGNLAICPLPLLSCIALLLESGGRSLEVLYPGQCGECVWRLFTTESFSLVRNAFKLDAWWSLKACIV